MDITLIDFPFIHNMHVEAAQNERKRMNYDLRTTPDDQSQRMLNVLEVGTQVPIHRHLHRRPTRGDLLRGSGGVCSRNDFPYRRGGA